MHSYTFIKLPWIWLCVASITNTTATASKETSNKSNERFIFRSRFTFTRPTSDNVLSILLGGSKCREDHREERLICDNGMTKMKFNHDSVGITKPGITNHDYSLLFPSCSGYPPYRKKQKGLSLCNNFGSKKSGNIQESDHVDDTKSTICSTTVYNGWRILRFSKRVGYGKKCYKKVREEVFDWDFESRGCNKAMGILSATFNQQHEASLGMNVSNEKSQQTSFPWYTRPRRSLLATFTEIRFPKPFKSLFVVSPVHVAYEIRDAGQIPRCLYSSTSYATLSGHLLAGEERVSVIWRKGSGDAVDVEIVSFSRSAPSIGGKIVWPFIGRMQKKFFLAEMDHLCGSSFII